MERDKVKTLVMVPIVRFLLHNTIKKTQDTKKLLTTNLGLYKSILKMHRGLKDVYENVDKETSLFEKLTALK